MGCVFRMVLVQFLKYLREGCHLNNEKNLRCLGCIGDYTTQLYGDYNKPF